MPYRDYTRLSLATALLVPLLTLSGGVSANPDLDAALRARAHAAEAVAERFSQAAQTEDAAIGARAEALNAADAAYAAYLQAHQSDTEHTATLKTMAEIAKAARIDAEERYTEAERNWFEVEPYLKRGAELAAEERTLRDAYEFAREDLETTKMVEAQAEAWLFGDVPNGAGQAMLSWLTAESGLSRSKEALRIARYDVANLFLEYVASVQGLLPARLEEVVIEVDGVGRYRARWLPVSELGAEARSATDLILADLDDRIAALELETKTRREEREALLARYPALTAKLDSDLADQVLADYGEKLGPAAVEIGFLIGTTIATAGVAPAAQKALEHAQTGIEKGAAAGFSKYMAYVGGDTASSSMEDAKELTGGVPVDIFASDAMETIVSHAALSRIPGEALPVAVRPKVVVIKPKLPDPSKIGRFSAKHGPGLLLTASESLAKTMVREYFSGLRTDAELQVVSALIELYGLDQLLRQRRQQDRPLEHELVSLRIARAALKMRGQTLPVPVQLDLVHGSAEQPFEPGERLDVTFTFSRPISGAKIALVAEGASEAFRAAPIRAGANVWQGQVTIPELQDALSATLEVHFQSVAPNDVADGDPISVPAIDLTAASRWSGVEQTDRVHVLHLRPAAPERCVRTSLPDDLDKPLFAGITWRNARDLARAQGFELLEQDCDVWQEYMVTPPCPTMTEPMLEAIGNGDVSLCQNSNPVTGACEDARLGSNSSAFCLDSSGQLLLRDGQPYAAFASDLPQEPAYFNLNARACDGRASIEDCPRHPGKPERYLANVEDTLLLDLAEPDMTVNLPDIGGDPLPLFEPSLELPDLGSIPGAINRRND